MLEQFNNYEDKNEDNNLITNTYNTQSNQNGTHILSALKNKYTKKQSKKELINILDRGKDSFDNFNNNTSNENSIKIVKKQKASIEELAKQMENQDIMAEKIYLANKKNEQAMIDINQVIDRQRKTWKDLTGEVEKYYSKLSSEEVDKGLIKYN